MGVLARLAARLGRTREAIGDGISGLFRGGREIDAARRCKPTELQNQPPALRLLILAN